MLPRLYVYTHMAFPEDAVAKHHPRLVKALAEPLTCLGLLPKMVFRIEGDGFHALTVDPVELHRLRRRHPQATVRVIPVMR